MLGNVLISSPCFLFAGVESCFLLLYANKRGIRQGRGRYDKRRKGEGENVALLRSRWGESFWRRIDGSYARVQLRVACRRRLMTCDPLLKACDLDARVPDLRYQASLLPTNSPPSFSIPLLFPVSSPSHLSKFTRWTILRRV